MTIARLPEWIIIKARNFFTYEVVRMYKVHNGKETPNKINRILSLYTKLREGRCIHADEEAKRHGVTVRSIQRDIKDLQEYLQYQQEEDTLLSYVIFYDRRQKGYMMKTADVSTFSNSEILAICKILLDSRAFTKKEMTAMLDKLVTNCVTAKNRDVIRELIKNEAFHYIEPHHKKVFIDKLWTIGQAIRSHHYIEIAYTRSKDKKLVARKLKPAAIMFSEYYFYLTAFIEDKDVQQHFDVINDAFPTPHCRLKGPAGYLPRAVRRPVSRRGISQTGTIHVRRPAAAHSVYLFRTRCRSYLRSPAHGCHRKRN